VIPKQTQNLPWRAIGDRCVVINPGRGEVHELDEIGSFLWRAADGTRSVEQIGEELGTSFDVDPAQAAGDIREFFGQLESLGLLTCQF
jgi:hypothetical protein